MEKQNNHEYGQTDPDFIDQNTLVNNNQIQSEDQYQHKVKKEHTEFGESDPDYIDQNTLVDNDNYARDEDPYQYQEEFIEDLKHPENDFQNNKNSDQKKKLEQEEIKNKNEAIINDDKKNDLNKDNV